MSSSAAEDSSELRLFDEQESSLVTEALAALREVAPADERVLSDVLARLRDLTDMLGATPSLYTETSFAGNSRSYDTLVDHLCTSDGLAGELTLPIKATLSRTFLVAKIQFLRGMVRAARVRADDDTTMQQTELDLRDELAQSIYTQLAEELLLALLRKPDVHGSTKRRAAGQLIAIWENAALEIDDFCPLLESAWHARNRVNADLGSLLGTSEYFRLVCEECSPTFLDFFNRDEVSLQQKQAFEEFLFDMTFEEVRTLRNAMRDRKIDTISPEDAAELLGRPIERESNQRRIDPVALYRSYFRRQLAADFRIVAGRPGPRRTAEAYMMIYLLDNPHEVAPDRDGR